MDRFLDDVANAYDRGIQAPGKEIHFLILLSCSAYIGLAVAPDSPRREITASSRCG